MIECGIEIEFLSNNYLDLFYELSKITDFDITGDKDFSSKDKVIIKPESTVRGYEINIPPNISKSILGEILSLFSKNTYFVDNCAMHIHIYLKDYEEVEKVKQYYLKNELKIIEECINKNMYLNLNGYLTTSDNHFDKKFLNLNTVKSFDKHHTVEHRIYKATFNYDEVIWAIEQTKEIISNALGGQ